LVNRNFGSLTLEEVDQFVNNHISDAERRLTESGKKAPMMELDIDGYKARKKEVGRRAEA